MDWLGIFRALCIVVGLLLGGIYLHHALYTGVGLLLGRDQSIYRPQVKPRRYAVLIAARNEEGVIGELIGSLKGQKYPPELLDIYVVADNCDDGTAPVAQEAGAGVFIRRDSAHVGKGYALDFLWHRLREEGLEERYDGYFIFDADNLVDPHFVDEMNRIAQSGDFVAVTGYRNAKNFGESWVTAGYGLWFLREARLVNAARMFLGVTCAVSGTGFLVSADLLRARGGWPWHLLTEDAQFSAEIAAQGKRIAYCDGAVFYDEQPPSFRVSWTQRKRWTKGFFQVTAQCGPRLWRGLGQGGLRGFGCWDLLTKYAQGAVTLGAGALLALAALPALLTVPAQAVPFIALLLGKRLLAFYGGTALLGLLVVLAEWERIPASPAQKLRAVLTLPLFLATYLPITVCALFQKVAWEPIRHGP